MYMIIVIPGSGVVVVSLIDEGLKVEKPCLNVMSVLAEMTKSISEVL